MFGFDTVFITRIGNMNKARVIKDEATVNFLWEGHSIDNVDSKLFVVMSQIGTYSPNHLKFDEKRNMAMCTSFNLYNDPVDCLKNFFDE
jgi:hypothetical protein